MSTDNKPGTFQQRLGLFDATMLVAGSMIGSGIFIVSAGITRDVGSSGWLLFIWILTGVITIMGALSYAELAAMMPKAGGQYVYLREAFGPLWGFLYGWTFFLVIQTGFIAAVSVAFAKYLGVLAPRLGTNNELFPPLQLGIWLQMPVPWLDRADWPDFFKHETFSISAGQLVAVGVAAVLTFINCFGVQGGKVIQNIFTVTKLLSLAVLIMLGWTIAYNADTLAANFMDIWDGIWTTKQFFDVKKLVSSPELAVGMVVAAAMVGSLFSSDSWNNVTFTAGETRDPKRNLPRSLALGTIIVTVLYVLVNLTYLAALPIQGDEKKALKFEAEARREESVAAKANVNVKLLEAKIAEAEITLLTRKEDLAKLDQQSQDSQRHRLEVAISQLAEDIKSWRTTAAEQQKHVESVKKLAKKLDSEAAFARGISGAKEDRVGTAVLERAAPALGVPFMAIAIMISTFGCVNGLVLAGPRLYYAMAQDGVFFKSVGHLNSRGVPAIGLVLQCLWSIVLVFSGSYNDLLDYTIFAALVFYALTVAGLFVLRRTQPNAERPYRAIGYPIMPALYVICCTVIMLDLLIVKPVYSWPSFLIVLAGIPVYFLWRGKSNNSAMIGK